MAGEIEAGLLAYNNRKKWGLASADDSADVQAMKSSGMTSEYLDTLDDMYRKKFGRGMPGEVYGQLKGSRSMADEMTALLNMSGTDLTNAAVTDPDLANKLVSWNFMSNAQLANAQNLKAQADAEAKAAESKYKFEMPSEWTTIEDLATKTLQAGRPTFDASSVNQWTNEAGTGTLDKTYKSAEDKLSRQQRNYWAMLFPYSGTGTGTQASKDLSAFGELNANKYATALDYAKSDYATKLAEYTGAQDKLSGIGQFKAQADQFKSSADATNYWNTLQLAWQKQQDTLAAAREEDAWTKQKSLAEYLANVGGNKSTDYLDVFAKSAASGAGQGLMTYLMASSRTFKKEIEPNKINGLDIIDSLDMVNYKYKGEDKGRIGLIAEDSPDLITNDDKKALDVVNLFGVLLDAVQRLSLQVKALEGRV